MLLRFNWLRTSERQRARFAQLDQRAESVSVSVLVEDVFDELPVAPVRHSSDNDAERGDAASDDLPRWCVHENLQLAACYRPGLVARCDLGFLGALRQQGRQQQLSKLLLDDGRSRESIVLT